MNKLAVFVPFVPDRYDKEIAACAEKLGFKADFYASLDALLPEIHNYEIIYGDIGPAAAQKASSLRWLCSPNAGIEKYLPADAMPEGCILSNSSGSYGPAIAEHIVMVLLMLMRRMPEYQVAMTDHSWPEFSPIRSILGSNIVILGTGDLGSNAARRLKLLGANVTGVCRSGKCSEPAFGRVVKATELDDLLPGADALILALPSTPDTIGILSRRRIAKLGKHTFVVSVGRGNAIDQEALVEALQSRSIAGAALDVMVPEPLPKDHPLWSCPNTIITPHVSGNTALNYTCRMNVDMFLEDLQRYVEGKLPIRLVNRKTGY